MVKLIEEELEKAFEKAAVNYFFVKKDKLEQLYSTNNEIFTFLLHSEGALEKIWDISSMRLGNKSKKNRKKSQVQKYVSFFLKTNIFEVIEINIY